MRPLVQNTNEFLPAQEVSILNIFPTTIIRGLFDLPHEDVAEDCRRLVAKVKERYPNEPTRNYTTYFDEDIREETHALPWFMDFSDTAKDTYIEFIRTQYNMEVRNLSRSDIHFFAWISVYNQPHFHPTHNHEHCHVSGTYYVKCEREDQPIKFLNPSLLATANLHAVSHERNGDDYIEVGTDGHQQEISFKNQTGEFLMWPSYMQHEVPVNSNVDQDYERIAISFNFKHNQVLDNTMTGTPLYYGDTFNG